MTTPVNYEDNDWFTNPMKSMAHEFKTIDQVILGEPVEQSSGKWVVPYRMATGDKKMICYEVPTDQVESIKRYFSDGILKVGGRYVFLIQRKIGDRRKRNRWVEFDYVHDVKLPEIKVKHNKLLDF